MMKNHLYLESDEQALTTVEAAASLGISPASMIRLFQRGSVQAARDWADHWKTTPAALRAYLRRSSSELSPRSKASLKKFVFRHRVHGTVTATRFEMCKKFGLDSGSVGKLVAGRLKSTGGWRCLGPAPEAQE